MEVLTDVDYEHAKKIFKIFNHQNIGEYHNLYVQSDTILFADYEVDPSHFICTWISIVSLFKKDRNKIRIVNRYWYVVNGRKKESGEKFVMKYIDTQKQIINT